MRGAVRGVARGSRAPRHRGTSARRINYSVGGNKMPAEGKERDRGKIHSALHFCPAAPMGTRSRVVASPRSRRCCCRRAGHAGRIPNEAIVHEVKGKGPGREAYFFASRTLLSLPCLPSCLPGPRPSLFSGASFPSHPPPRPLDLGQGGAWRVGAWAFGPTRIDCQLSTVNNPPRPCTAPAACPTTPGRRPPSRST